MMKQTLESHVQTSSSRVQQPHGPTNQLEGIGLTFNSKPMKAGFQTEPQVLNSISERYRRDRDDQLASAGVAGRCEIWQFITRRYSGTPSATAELVRSRRPITSVCGVLGDRVILKSDLSL